jgi:hypothetical protein
MRWLPHAVNLGLTLYLLQKETNKLFSEGSTKIGPKTTLHSTLLELPYGLTPPPFDAADENYSFPL